MKKIPNTLETALDKAVKFVSFIKSRPLHSRIFSVLHDEMGNSFTMLLLLMEV
jgi:hypothetical protein